MPKFTLPSDAAADLKEANPDSAKQFTMRLSPKLVERVALLAGRSGNQLTRELVSIIAEFCTAEENGVVIQFEPSMRQRIDLIADHMSMSREEAVRWMLAENLHRTMQRVIDLRKETDDAAKTLGKIPKPKG